MSVTLFVKHAPRKYCRLWPVRLYSIFLHYLIKRTTFEQITAHKMCFLFLLQLVSETFLIVRITGRDMIKMYIGRQVNYSSPVLMKLEFSSTSFYKPSNMEYNENPLSGGRVGPCGQKDGHNDRHDTVNSPFRNFARASKIQKEK